MHMPENARSHNRSPKISFEVGDAALPYEDGSFNRVASMLVLFFIPGPQSPSVTNVDDFTLVRVILV
jgi:hypothetical protein